MTRQPGDDIVIDIEHAGAQLNGIAFLYAWVRRRYHEPADLWQHPAQPSAFDPRRRRQFSGMFSPDFLDRSTA